MSSLAGRVRKPSLPVGVSRVGGFGGVDGLRTWLTSNGIDAVVDATHPFADRMTGNAVSATAPLGIPLLILQRPPWTEQPGDRWTRVPSTAAAAGVVPSLGKRAFCTIGRQGVDAFAHVDDVWFLIRCIDPPEGALPPKSEVLLERGPFTIEHELHLVRQHRLDVLITKNSGGDQTAAKLEAARTVGIPVVMIDRPELPHGVEVVESERAAAEWLRARSARS